MAKKPVSTHDPKGQLPLDATVINPELDKPLDETVINPTLDKPLDETVINPTLDKPLDGTVINPALDKPLDETETNPELSDTKEGSEGASDGTEVNLALFGESDPGVTEDNPLLYGESEREEGSAPVSRNSATELNTVLPGVGEGKLIVGEVLFDKYIVERWLRSSGEADIYLCSSEDGTLYIAKHYNRREGLKPEVLAALRSIDSPYIMPIYDYGTYKDTALEIGKFYPQGSLQDKLDRGVRFSFEEIKEEILPALNKALHTLHTNGILHRDVKPANLMLLPRGEGVALIDFGISTYIDKNESITIEDRGRTPIYVAPEQAEPYCLCYSGSDYYSAGIVLYALFCGQPPSADCRTMADILRDRLSNGIVFPDDMTDEFRRLLYSLTYQDISRRGDPDESRRRWGYAEVERFLAGDVVRTSGSSDRDYTDAIEPYSFDGKVYTSVSSLVNAMGENWSAAIEELKASRLSHFFTAVDSYPKLADICRQEEANFTMNRAAGDLALWALLCRLNPRSDLFFWQGKRYNSYSALGEDMLDRLLADDKSECAKWDAILEQGLLSAFLTMKMGARNREGRDLHSLRDRILALESDHREKVDGERGKERRYYETAYILSARPFEIDFTYGDEERRELFDSVEKLASYMKALYREDFDLLSAFCHRLFTPKNEMSIPFEAWLLVKGKGEALAEFSGKKPPEESTDQE